MQLTRAITLFLGICGLVPAQVISNSTCCENVAPLNWIFSTTGRRATPNFSNESGLNLEYVGLFGQNDPTAVSKRTFNAFSINSLYPGSGQRIAITSQLNASGMGDAIVSNNILTAFGSRNAGGDEATMLYRGSIQTNPGGPISTTIISSATSCAVSTVTTADINRIVSNSGQTPQSASVSSTTGINVGAWCTIQSSRLTAGGTNNEEVVQIVSVTPPTSFTAVFLKDHPSGSTVTQSVVLGGSFSTNYGQDRNLIDLTQAVNGTGTISSNDVTYTGIGTNFSNSLVGGTATNPGCVAANADTVTSSKSWFPLNVISSTTSETIFTQASPARSTELSGSAYSVAPCAAVRNFVFDSSDPSVPPVISALVLSTNPFTWTAGDSIESAVTPDGAVSGFNLIFYPSQPGWNWNNALNFYNLGSRDTSQGAMRLIGSNSAGWHDGIQFFNTRIPIEATSDGVHIGPVMAIATAPGDPKKITWGGATTAIDHSDWELGPEDSTGNFVLHGAYFGGNFFSINSVTGQFTAPILGVNLSTPANSSATCSAGAIWADTEFAYVCIATNTIKRIALSSF